MQGRNRDEDTKNGCVDVGREKGGMNDEIGFDM